MGAGGVIVPPEGYFEAIGAVCRKHDVLIDLRRGDLRLRAHRRSGSARRRSAIEPNVALDGQAADRRLPAAHARGDRRRHGGGGRGELGQIGTFGHGYTYGGHPVACAVGVKALEIYERMDMPARVRALAPALRGASRPARRAPAGRRGPRISG